MNTTLLVILILALVGINGAILFVVLRRRPADAPKADDTGLKLLLDQMNELNRTVDRRINETSRTITESMRDQRNESQKVAGESQRLVDQFLR